MRRCWERFVTLGLALGGWAALVQGPYHGQSGPGGRSQRPPFADRYVQGESPVGRRVTFNRVGDSVSVWYPIVAVVGNERMQPTSEPVPEIIGHPASDVPGLLRFVVKAEGSPDALMAAVRAAIPGLDRDVPVLNLRTMEAAASEALADGRYVMVLLGVFAFVALVLAAGGV